MHMLIYVSAFRTEFIIILYIPTIPLLRYAKMSCDLIYDYCRTYLYACTIRTLTIILEVMQVTYAISDYYWKYCTYTYIRDVQGVATQKLQSACNIIIVIVSVVFRTSSIYLRR